MAGTVAAVTNVTGPVGQAAARRLASECTRLVLAAPPGADPKPVLDEVRRIRALHRLPHEPILVVADAETEAGARAVCGAAMQAFGRLDALVHNGMLGVSHGGDGAPALAAEPFVHVVRAAAETMGHPEGSVVLTALLDGAWPGPLDDAPKVTATGAFSALTHAAAKAVYPFGLTLNGIVVEDPADLSLAEARPLTAWHQDRQRRSHQLYDAAYAARFLASTEGRGVTGQTLLVTGGRTPAAPPYASPAESASYASYFTDLEGLRASARRLATP